MPNEHVIDRELRSTAEQSTRALLHLGWDGAAIYLHNATNDATNSESHLLATASPSRAELTLPETLPTLPANGQAAPDIPAAIYRFTAITTRRRRKTIPPLRVWPTAAGTPPWSAQDRLLIPLTAEDDHLGWLVVTSDQATCPTPDRLQTLSTFASQIARTLHATTRFTRLQRHTAQQDIVNELLHNAEQKRRSKADALAELAKIVNSTLELDEVFDLALERIGRVVSYDTAAIMLIEDEGTLFITACRGFKHPEQLLGSSFRLEENNIAHATMNAQHARVERDVQLLPNWGHNRDDIEGAHAIRAWIGTPLIARGRSIGILTLDKYQPDAYTEEDGETIIAFAAQIATAIQNARLYEAVQTQRDQLAAILTDATDAIIVIDENKTIWRVNPAAERNLGIAGANVIGQPIQVLGLPTLTQTTHLVQKTGEAMTCEISGLDKRDFNASIAPVRNVGWVIVMQDITPLKELDRLRTEWVATVSHDLKNPIQAVQFGTALLEMDGPLNETQQERIEIIQRSIEQLTSLVTDVLDLARLEAGSTQQMAELNPADLLEEAIQEIESLALKKGQRIEQFTGPDLPPVWGDHALLVRALTNLLSNAVKYTPHGGTISTRAWFANQTLTLSISDTGPGISHQVLPHIFDRFYRAPDTTEEGTGLGLSIVKTIAEKHNGTIQIETEPGQGSTFTLLLPPARRN